MTSGAGRTGGSATVKLRVTPAMLIVSARLGQALATAASKAITRNRLRRSFIVGPSPSGCVPDHCLPRMVPRLSGFTRDHKSFQFRPAS
jgi:hypothetical protein